jgi:hypothetical protein
MKTLITFLVALFCAIPLFSQKVAIGDRILITEECNMYDQNSSVFGKPTRLLVGDTVTIIQLEDKAGYYAIKLKGSNGYINTATVVTQFKNLNPSYKVEVQKVKDIAAKRRAAGIEEGRRDDIEYYTKLWGKPDNTSDYKSGNTWTRTLVWYCAADKYRSVDFQYVNGTWIKDTEYSSDCI